MITHYYESKRHRSMRLGVEIHSGDALCESTETPKVMSGNRNKVTCEECKKRLFLWRFA